MIKTHAFFVTEETLAKNDIAEKQTQLGARMRKLGEKSKQHIRQTMDRLKDPERRLEALELLIAEAELLSEGGEVEEQDRVGVAESDLFEAEKEPNKKEKSPARGESKTSSRSASSKRKVPVMCDLVDDDAEIQTPATSRPRRKNAKYVIKQEKSRSNKKRKYGTFS